MSLPTSKSPQIVTLIHDPFSTPASEFFKSLDRNDLYNANSWTKGSKILTIKQVLEGADWGQEVCAACNILLTADNTANDLCIRCHLEIEDEKAELEEEDAASVALATAAAEAGLSCGPCSDPFDSVLLIGLEKAFGNDHTKWKQWAVEVGVALLKERLI